MNMILASSPDPVTTITTATSDMGTELLTVGGAAIGVGVLVFVLRRGWGFFKSLTK